MIDEFEMKKAYLRQYIASKQYIARCELEIEELRLSQIMASKNNDGMPGMKNGHSDLSDYVARLEKLENKRAAAVQEHIEVCEKVLELIGTLENETEKLILELRYIKGKAWEDIWLTYEDMTGFEVTMRWIFRKHKAAIDHLELPIDESKEVAADEPTGASGEDD